MSNNEIEKKCEACGGEGWWCRGCDGSTKRRVLTEMFGKEEAETIYHIQFGSCGYLVPCYVCNRDEGTFWFPEPEETDQ